MMKHGHKSSNGRIAAYVTAPISWILKAATQAKNMQVTSTWAAAVYLPNKMKSKQPLHTYKHKTRTVYVHEVDKFEWMETTKGYFVPNQKKGKIGKYRKDSIPSNAISTVTAIKNDLIPSPPKPVPYKEQVLYFPGAM